MSALTWWQQVLVVYTAAGLPLSLVLGVLLGRAIRRNEEKTRAVYARSRRARVPVAGSTRWESRP